MLKSKEQIIRSWVCPHCFRREDYDRFLITDGEEISPTRDRRWYRHIRSSFGLKQAPKPLNLLDPRLMYAHELLELNEAWEEEDSICANRFCIHCHMQSVQALEGAALTGVLYSDPYLIPAPDAAPLTGREITGPGQWYITHTTTATNLIVRRDRGCQWLAIHTPNNESNMDYRSETHSRMLREASGYVLLLRLDQHGDTDACLLLEDLVLLHGDADEVRQKAAGIMVVMPQGETEADLPRHTRLFELLNYAFSRFVITVLDLQLPNADQINETIRKLAELQGIADASAEEKNPDPQDQPDAPGEAPSDEAPNE